MDPASVGQGGRLDEPLLLVMKLAVDETDAIFGGFVSEYFRHVPQTGTWSTLAGGFNRWVETYYREVLGGTRPVLVTVQVSACYSLFCGAGHCFRRCCCRCRCRSWLLEELPLTMLAPDATQRELPLSIM